MGSGVPITKSKPRRVAQESVLWQDLLLTQRHLEVFQTPGQILSIRPLSSLTFREFSLWGKSLGSLGSPQTSDPVAEEGDSWEAEKALWALLPLPLVPAFGYSRHEPPTSRRPPPCTAASAVRSHPCIAAQLCILNQPPSTGPQRNALRAAGVGVVGIYGAQAEKMIASSVNI